MIHLLALRCYICDAGPVFAVAPGTEPDGATPAEPYTPRAANADRGVQARAWCWSCWAARFACVEQPGAAVPRE